MQTLAEEFKHSPRLATAELQLNSIDSLHCEPIVAEKTAHGDI